MKKLLFAALAALAVSTGAYAQSSVQVYGTLDVGAAYSDSEQVTGTPGVKSGIYSGIWTPSSIGFKGSENLGSGMKAVFVLDYAINVANNSGIDAANEQSLGIESPYGTVKAGRLEATESVYQRRFDAMGKTSFSPLTSLYGQDRFLSSTAGYQHSYAGFDFGATYSFDGTTNTATLPHAGGVDQENALSLNIGYGYGPFDVGYIYSNVSNLARAPKNSDIDSHFVGGSFNFGVAKVFGSYSDTQAKDSSVFDTNMYAVGASVPLGKATVAVAYGRVNDDVANSEANIYGVQGYYELSKRTGIYAGYQYVDNRNGSSVAALGNLFGTPTTGTGDTTSQGAAVGMKHSF